LFIVRFSFHHKEDEENNSQDQNDGDNNDDDDCPDREATTVVTVETVTIVVVVKRTRTGLRIFKVTVAVDVAARAGSRRSISAVVLNEAGLKIHFFGSARIQKSIRAVTVLSKRRTVAKRSRHSIAVRVGRASFRRSSNSNTSVIVNSTSVSFNTSARTR